jgi:hypothetical protein
LRKGLEIPEPKKGKDEYSGRFLVRLPKILHQNLALGAQENGISLNQYIIYLLASNFELDKQGKQFNRLISEISSIGDVIWNIHGSHRWYKISELGRGTKGKGGKARVIKFPDFEGRNVA